MTVDIHSEEGHVIRQLIPLSTIPVDQFETICNKISVEEVGPNSFLFKRNDTENDLVYLIEGSVRLQSDCLIVDNISSGSASSKFALAHQIPRKIDALTQTTVRFLRLQSNILDALPGIDSKQEDNIHMAVDEPAEDDENNDDDDWMTTLLKSPIFRALPPANLQQIVMSLEEIKVDKGDFIIHQGEPGDFYYLIKRGYCLISRKPSANAKEIKLAQLRAQDTFGEDALLSGEPRNVSVSALTDVSLIRLSKEKFISLIKEPSLKFIPYTQLAEEISQGAILVDVRAVDEYNKQHLPHSVNVPFFSLRMYLKSIDKKKPVIVVCENGKTSEAAAFLLLRNKIQAKIVKGGIESVSAESVVSAAAFNIDDGIETLTSDNVRQESSEIESSAFEAGDEESLRLENQQLKDSIKSLQAEKEELEMKYRLLYKQSEKLKSVLDALKNKGG